MKPIQISKTVLACLWKIPLCAFAYMAGTMASGALVSSLGMALPKFPERADEKTMGLCLLAGTFAIALGIAPLARRIRARYLVRLLILAGLCYVCIGVNTPIEAAIFTSLGGMSTMAVLAILPCLLFAAVTALLFRPAGETAPFGPAVSNFLSGRHTREWAWRVVAAICAFPAVYLMFGMSVAPWVVKYYEQEQFGLVLPSLAVIVLVQLLRSLFFFLVALPILAVWSGSRRQLTALLGLAFFVLVGLFGMIQAYWLSPVLQALHGVEILADSVAYAGVLAMLFLPGRASRFAAAGTLAIA